ncbi:Hypothetical predicted protein [Paramuricea clavata]|uniref:Uncharacterized protein n=1 Tax=Paramuricea clavata TaxID=317549 RepID=A0A7D9HW44_PARCT|nr:Hypothetical predicted protein [Paramuricea clavata]
MERAWNTDVWIGLSDENTSNTFKWSDGIPVSWTNWAVGNPRGAWTGDHQCVYMNLERTTKELMYWRGGECSEKKLFICKKIITSSSATTTPKTALGGSCSFGWTLFKNNCYRYYNYRRSWKGSRLFCYSRSSSPRGNLASVTSKEENDFIANLANTTIWIGLEGRGVYRGHAWSDKTPVSYTNWDVGQPDSYNGREACTQLYGDIGYWSDVNCFTLKPFVCKRKMTSGTGPRTTVSTTFAQSSRCKEDWYLFSNMCYMISNSSNYKSWHEAETSCKRMGGHLASVTNNEEKDFLRQLIRPKFVYSFWIGLHDVGGESLYKWTDGTGYGKFIYWRNGEPNNYHGQEDCVSMARADGKWNDNHCSQKKPYICKSNTEDSLKVTVLKPASKVGKNGYCDPGWVPNGQYCYEFHNDESDYKTWRDAKNTCEKGTNSSAIGELVSITNELEQAFVTLNLKGSKTPLWIGMNNLHDYRSYFWVDNSPANFYHWNKGQPPSFSSRCVEISPFLRDAGKWTSTPCYSKKGYICKTAAKTTPVVPAIPIPTRTTESPSFKCSKEYIQYDESCYMFVNSSKTFDEARDACRKEEAELISVDSEFEQALLVFLMERNLGTVWIGVSKEPWSALKFTDHSVPHYSYWGPGQPDRPLDQRTCVLANVTGYNVGRWYDVDCSTKNPYVCEIYHGENKITLEENTTCEAGWQKYRKNCYKYFQLSKSWPAAQYMCRNNGGDLVSIADDLEQDFAMFYFSNIPRTWLWIGLHDRGDEGGYEWSDYSPLTYVNWMRNQPNDVGQTQNCVVMDSRDGRWYDWRCGAMYSFVCKKPLECSSKIPLNKEMITVSNDIAADFSVEQAILNGNTPENLTWCPNTTTGIQPRIQVDLYDLVKISSITTKGRMVRGAFVQVHQYVKSFLVEYTADGYTWQTYSRRGIDIKFFANYDGTTPVTKAFDPPIVASSIAILPAVIKGAQPCMKLSLQGCDFVCQAALGMSNWKIPDNSITASSAKYPTNAPWNAKTKSVGWCAKINDKNQWIQVNFGQTNLVTKIRTFGDTKGSYVKSYLIQISGDGIEWVNYKQNSGVRIFMGNMHAAHPVTHTLTDVSQAQYIRIVPLSWKNNICMRFELFGCVAGCNGPLIQKGNNEISDVKLTSPDPKSNPEYARMDSGKAWCTSAKPGKYLEVDFGKAVRLKTIATKGSPTNYGEPRHVVTYTLEFYRNNKWKKYMLDNSIKYIVAGTMNDSTTLYKYSFPARRNGNGIIVRKIRIYPKQFTPAGICMRVEFYGCLAEAEIIPTTPTTLRDRFVRKQRR